MKGGVINGGKKVENEFGGQVLPFSAVDNRYNEAVLEFFLNGE